MVVGLTVMEPSTATEDPLIVQLVALVVVQLRVELPTLVMVLGLAPKLSIVGAGVVPEAVIVTSSTYQPVLFTELSHAILKRTITLLPVKEPRSTLT